jgi:hypothetical protein
MIIYKEFIMHYSKILFLLLVISPYAWAMKEKETQENLDEPRSYKFSFGNRVLVIKKTTRGERRNNAIGKPGECESLLTSGTKKSCYSK